MKRVAIFFSFFTLLISPLFSVGVVNYPPLPDPSTHTQYYNKEYQINHYGFEKYPDYINPTPDYNIQPYDYANYRRIQTSEKIPVNYYPRPIKPVYYTRPTY